MKKKIKNVKLYKYKYKYEYLYSYNFVLYLHRVPGTLRSNSHE